MADEPDEQPSVGAGIFGQPFSEQVAFFRQKLGNLVPTQRWDDLKKAQHDTGFMLAGAQKADFLAAVGASMDKAISKGTGLETFRKDFAAAVKQHNWHGWTGEGTKAGEAWRTRIIYTTNMSTSYAAGRYAQLKQHGFSHWVYHHADGVARPRPWHVAWNGLVLPSDDAFWDAHYPPCGWHCHCYVTGADSADDAQLDGGKPDKPRPNNWNQIDPKTGEPVGIDKGWGYAPGKTVAQTVTTLAKKMDSYPRPLSVAAIRHLTNSPAFQRWKAAPQGNWPLARLPKEDLTALGANEGVTVAKVSPQTMAKQNEHHPELTVADYAAAQEVVDNATGKALKDNRDTTGNLTGTQSMVYVKAVDAPDDGESYVLIVKVTQDKNELFVSSLYRLSKSQARRDSEIRRLLGE